MTLTHPMPTDPPDASTWERGAVTGPQGFSLGVLFAVIALPPGGLHLLTVYR